MVTFNNLLAWDGAKLRDAGDALVAASHKYEQVSADLKIKSLGDGLAGETAEAEAKARRILADDAEDLWTGLGKSGHDLIDAGTTVDAIYGAAHNLVSRIKGDGLEISEVGAITPSETSEHDGEPRSRDVDHLIWGYERERDRLVEQARDTIEFISSVYDEIAALDDTANGPSPEVVNAGDRAPDPNWTPSQVNDWWTSLSPELQQHIIQKHPSWVGGRDGIPMQDRHDANMVWLPIMQNEIDQKVNDFEPKTRRVWRSSPGSPAGGYFVDEQNPEYAALLQRQKDIHALSAMFNNPERAEGHSLLVLDNSGDHFRAAIGSGDVDNADHVVVFTPGMTTTVDGGLVHTDTDPDKNGNPGSAVGDTERILTESGLPWRPDDDRLEGRSEQELRNMDTVAGVTWLGYDAPNWDETLSFSEGTVLNDNEAQKAGPDLASFYNGVQETHHGDPHLLADGHSYGSTGTGYALLQSTAPDDLSVWGTPGPSSVDASDLNMLPDHMFVTATDDDLVAASGLYGGNPVTDSESDFSSLDAGRHGDLGASSGHSEYTKPGSTSLHNQAKILRGQQPDYVNNPSIK